MKWIVVMGAVLALSPVAFGAASFTLTESGTTATAVYAEAGDTISIDLHMTAESSVDAIGLALEASTTGIFDVSARTWASGLGVPIDQPTFLSDPGLDTKTNNAGAASQTGFPFPAGPSVLETIDLDIDTGADDGVYIISIADPGGGLYVQYVDTGAGENNDGYDYGEGLILGTFEVTIPEPASMLLLVGALPFLRRRRSA